MFSTAVSRVRWLEEHERDTLTEVAHQRVAASMRHALGRLLGAKQFIDAGVVAQLGRLNNEARRPQLDRSAQSHREEGFHGMHVVTRPTGRGGSRLVCYNGGLKRGSGRSHHPSDGRAMSQGGPRQATFRLLRINYGARVARCQTRITTPAEPPRVKCSADRFCAPIADGARNASRDG